MQNPINITGDGNAVGDGNHINFNKTTITSGATVADFTALLAQMRTAVESGGFEDKTARIIKSDLKVVEDEAAEEQPDKSIMGAKLASMAAIAKNAAIVGTAGVTLAPMIQHGIEMLGHLF